jgi:hypothetical protein
MLFLKAELISVNILRLMVQFFYMFFIYYNVEGMNFR